MAFGKRGFKSDFELGFGSCLSTCTDQRKRKKCGFQAFKHLRSISKLTPISSPPPQPPRRNANSHLLRLRLHPHHKTLPALHDPHLALDRLARRVPAGGVPERQHPRAGRRRGADGGLHRGVHVRVDVGV